MNRAIHIVAILAALGLAGNRVPAQGEPPAGTAQADPIEAFVTAIRQAEQRLKSVRVELETRGVFPSGLEFATSGTLYVLRGEQQKIRATVSLSFANDLKSLMDSVRTEGGIMIYKDDPAFGEVFVRVPPEVATDLEWAGTVLDRSDLPGMRDARAEAPLGSSMVEGLRREFTLAATARKRRGEDAGVWLAGERRPGLDDVGTELPLANRVELFIRDKDHAVLEVVHYQGDKVLQHIDVRSLEVDVEIPPAVFAVDGRGQPLREVDKYVPLWTQILDVLAQAEAKLLPADLAEGKDPPPASLRPSKRSKKK